MGIYVHIPFCRSKCYYCGFYSVASTQLKKAYIAALGHEIQLRKDYLDTSEVKTLYFGGGTPSWLSMDELTDIVTTLEMNFALNCVAERTIEANPEDITRDKLKGWRALGFNRLSIGIQSFNDEVLKRINRTHTAQDALRSVEWAADSGFEYRDRFDTWITGVYETAFATRSGNRKSFTYNTFIGLFIKHRFKYSL